VENPRKRSDREGHFEFTTRGISVMRKDMLHLCDTPTTKAKLLSEKATKSRTIHLIQASRHRPAEEDTESSGKLTTMAVAYQLGLPITCPMRIRQVTLGMDLKTLQKTKL
jgi:hypothetical protein